MKITLINGSPKVTENNSGYFLTELKNLLPGDLEISQLSIRKNTFSPGDLESVRQSDILVFAFPLYVDGIPSHLLRFLVDLDTYLNAQPATKFIRVYAVVNCGFYEGRQTHLAIEMMKNWCGRAGLLWGLGLGIGGGEMVGSLQSVPLGAGPKKNLGRALNSLAEAIRNSSGGDSIFISPNFPRFAYNMGARLSWNQRAKANGLSKRDLFRQ